MKPTRRFSKETHDRYLSANLRARWREIAKQRRAEAVERVSAGVDLAIPPVNRPAKSKWLALVVLALVLLFAAIVKADPPRWPNDLHAPTPPRVPIFLAPSAVDPYTFTQPIEADGKRGFRVLIPFAGCDYERPRFTVRMSDAAFPHWRAHVARAWNRPRRFLHEAMVFTFVSDDLGPEPLDWRAPRFDVPELVAPAVLEVLVFPVSAAAERRDAHTVKMIPAELEVYAQ